MSTQNENKEYPPTEWKIVGTAQLVIKRGAPLTEAKGIKIFPNRDDGKPDYSKPALFIFFGQLNALTEYGENAQVVQPVPIES